MSTGARQSVVGTLKMTQPMRTLVSVWSSRIVGALLCLVVTVIHIEDQGGISGSKTPTYVGIGYYLLEITGVLAALLLLSPAVRAGWLLAIGVAAGPFIGYILSRGPGLPNYTEDKGNWGEPLGVISLVVEGVLFVLAVVMTVNSRGRP
jgi:hypothetical protein